jgi:hypothetical protein
LIGGAFAVLAAAVGLGAVATALVAMRQIGDPAGQIRGRGLAITGLACGGSGIGVAVLGMLLAIVLAP